MANHEKDQHPPVQGATPEHSTQVKKTKVPGDTGPAPLTIAKWDGDDGNPDVIFYGIKGAHTPGDLFRSLAAYDPALVRMFAQAQTHKGRWMSPESFAEIEAEETIVPAETSPVPPNGLKLQPEPKAAPGFEGLKPAEELKRFFDLVGIKAHGFVISTRYEHRSRETGKWIESWSHYYAIRYGDGGNADLYDYLRYGGHKPSDEGKNSLLKRFSQKISDTFRATQYYIRTAEFEKDPIDGKVRSYEKTNVKLRRIYSVESDEGTLAQQGERIAYLKGKGLIASAEVFSGGKSIHLHFVRPRGWETTPEQDAYIDKGLCVLFRGDAAAIAPNNAFRLPGCDRPGGRHQRLLDGRTEPYSSYAELRSAIEALLAEEGIADQAEMEVAFAQRKAKSNQKRVRTAVERSRNSELGREWDDWEGWSETERKAARAFHQALSGEQLLDFIPRSEAELVRKGSPKGCRNNDGLKVTLSLRGAVDRLDDLGLKVEAAAQQVLDRFVEASEAVGGPVDVERLQAQYEGAEGAMPGRPVEAFMATLAYHSDGLLGKRREKSAEAGAKTKVELASLSYQELIDRSLAAINNRDLDTEMLLKAELKNHFRLSDDFISTALMRRYAESKAQAVAPIHDSVALAQVEQLEYLMDGWIPKADVALTYGPFGTGKTSLAVWKAYGYAKGVNILDRDTNCPPGKVLIIATDSGPGALKKTFDDLGIDVDHDPLLQPGHPAQRIWIWAHQPDQGHNSWVCDLHGLLRLEEHIKRHGISYVVIDSAKSVSASAGWSYTSNEAVKAMLTLLRQTICATTGACIEFLSHDGSIQGTHSGAKAWAEEPSMVIALSQVEAREGDNAAVRATFKKDRGAVVDPRRQLVYELNEDGLVLRPETPVVSTCDSAIIHVLWNAHLEGKDSLRTGEVIQAVSDLYLMASKTAENTLPRISGSGKGPNPTPVIKVARGRYALSPREIEQRTAKNTPLYRGFCSTGGG